MRIPRPVLETMTRYFDLLPDGLKWRLGKRLTGVLRVQSPADASSMVRCRDGFQIKVELADWLGSHLAVWREYESGLSEIIRTTLEKGDHFVDVGANIGYFSLLAARCVGREGRVTAVEASPENYARLLENIALNELDASIDCRQCAVWSEAAELIIHQGPNRHSGISSLRTLDESTVKHRVEAVPLDRMLHSAGAPPVRFVKIDIEGAEHQALLGMTELLSAQRPIIALELSDVYLKQLGSSSNDVLELLLGRFEYTPSLYDQRGAERTVSLEELQRRAKRDQLNVLFR